MLRDAPLLTILPTTNVDRAKTFYGDTLNLEPADKTIPGDALMYRCGGGTLLYIYAREAGTQAQHTVAGWMVEDVEEAVATLNDRGVEFEVYDMPGLKTNEQGVGEIEGAKVAWFKDPDGNILSITETPE